ncbi:CPBP family intramembrane metalloprotease, partial [Achromobacter xylosoxidans]
MTDQRQSASLSGGKLRFRSEVADFWRFIRHPHPASRLPGRASASGLV